MVKIVSYSNANRTKSRQNKYLFYLCLALFFAFSLAIFNFTSGSASIIYSLLSLHRKIPYSDFFVNIVFLSLCGLILIFYKRWKREIVMHRRDAATILSFQKAVETMQIGVTITDPEGRILYMNRAEAAMHGYKVDDLIGKHARIFAPPEVWNPNPPAVLERYTRETLNVRKDGSSFPVQLMSDIVRTPDGDVFAVVTTCEDITERRKNEETIKKLAFFDNLTGLPNRALFNDRLSQELAKAIRHKEIFAVIFVDLDCFKTVNDRLGHAMGDLLLQEVSIRLKGTIRQEDTVSRFGGDEFIILCTDIRKTEDVSLIAGKIIDSLSKVFELNNTKVHCTGSLGISLYPENGSSIELLVNSADAAMYYAKALGRNNYQFYGSHIDNNVTEKLQAKSDLRKVIERTEFGMNSPAPGWVPEMGE